MNTYIVTFHTHADAIVGHRSLAAQGLTARMMPVPRALSSSCGTCVRYEGETPSPESFSVEWEAIYQVFENQTYEKLLEGA